MRHGEIKRKKEKKKIKTRCGFFQWWFELLESSRRQDQPEPGPCGQTSTSWRTTLDCFIIPKQILLTVKHFPKHLFIHRFALVSPRLHSRFETCCKSSVMQKGVNSRCRRTIYEKIYCKCFMCDGAVSGNMQRSGCVIFNISLFFFKS